MISASVDNFGMDGHYGYVPHGAYYPEDDSPMVSPDLYGHSIHHLHTLSNENLQQYSDFDDPSMGLVSPHEGPKGRRRQLGLDHIKHKRTRSGCFTCRQRRVKVSVRQRSMGGHVVADCVCSSVTRLTPPANVRLFARNIMSESC